MQEEKPEAKIQINLNLKFQILNLKSCVLLLFVHILCIVAIREGFLCIIR